MGELDLTGRDVGYIVLAFLVLIFGLVAPASYFAIGHTRVCGHPVHERPKWLHVGKLCFGMTVAMATTAVGTAATVVEHVYGEGGNDKKFIVAVADCTLNWVLLMASCIEARNHYSPATLASAVISFFVMLFKIGATAALFFENKSYMFMYGLFVSGLATVAAAVTLLNDWAVQAGVPPVVAFHLPAIQEDGDGN